MITMTEETWNELKARATLAMDYVQAFVDCTRYDRRVLNGIDTDLRALLGEIDDANTRAAYMALAAKDQLGLFDVEGAAI